MGKLRHIVIYFIIFLLLFFYDPLVKIFPNLTSIDEIIGIIGFVMIIIILSRNLLASMLLNYTILLLILIGFIGVVSSYIGGINVTWTNRLIDLFSLYKIQFAFLGFLFIPKSAEKEKTLAWLQPIVKIFVSLALIFGLINLIHDIGMTHDIRFGMRSFEFIYDNPGTLNDRIFCSLGVLYSTGGGKKNKFFIFESLFVLFLTLRANAIGSLIVFVALFLFFGKKKKISLKNMIPVAFLAVLGGWTSINSYLVQDSTPRAFMLRNGIYLAKKYFPFGSGLGTYGSNIAFKFYSPLYYDFGYNLIYVLSPVVGTVANDNFWPMMLGQFGIFGTFLFFLMLILQGNFILKNFENKDVKVIAIVIFAYIFMKSMGEAVYTAEFGLMPYMIIAFLFQPNEDIDTEKD
ncbi:hypothetical protein NR458_07385 [Pediococcus ethanolidurans]|uniref:hypothetical protein n=1 Tax=Pediococcus ethanolidurans TaxID=319653 RepID=UPI0021E79067|nr:hypothetical protein [Pediococcus ethanolidurans]MCV3324105.1 hypothetical protein [Pediococcus ethanolidurans]